MQRLTYIKIFYCSEEHLVHSAPFTCSNKSSFAICFTISINEFLLFLLNAIVDSITLKFAAIYPPTICHFNWLYVGNKYFVICLSTWRLHWIRFLLLLQLSYTSFFKFLDQFLLKFSSLFTRTFFYMFFFLYSTHFYFLCQYNEHRFTRSISLLFWLYIWRRFYFDKENTCSLLRAEVLELL